MGNMQKGDVASVERVCVDQEVRAMLPLGYRVIYTRRLLPWERSPAQTHERCRWGGAILVSTLPQFPVSKMKER